jgi:hypothetical protein
MSKDTPIDRIYQELGVAIEALRKSGEVSAQVVVEDHARKALLLSVASHFEHKLTGHLKQLSSMSKNTFLTEFVIRKAITRQYHTLFKWDCKNANSFFALFGADFKQRMETKVKANTDLDNSIRAFLELGSLRNQLVHNDYATFSLEKTSDEIYLLYQTALYFIDSLPGYLSEPSCDDEEQKHASSDVLTGSTAQQQDAAAVAANS